MGKTKSAVARGDDNVGGQMNGYHGRGDVLKKTRN
jgi:hypothetical protein